MNWNASMPIWSVGVCIVLPLGLLSLALALIAARQARELKSIEMKSGVYIHERDETRLQRDKLNRENAEITARNADLTDALGDAQAEIKSLNMQTKEMPEIATQAPIPARPKRPPKQK